VSEAQLPSDVLARRVREIRKRRGWSQEDLAQRLAELDHPLDRAQVARIEGRRRKVSLDEAFAFAVALGVAPVNLFIPLERDEQFAISKKWIAPAWMARAWARGFETDERMVPLEDEQTYLTEMPREEYAAGSRTPWGMVFYWLSNLPYKKPFPLQRERLENELGDWAKIVSHDTIAAGLRHPATEDKARREGHPMPWLVEAEARESAEEA
jgi:transcriptional regulator with XRE-family HTH domain